MLGDLFRRFDYYWGGGFLFLRQFMRVLLLLVYIVNFVRYFLESSNFETIFYVWSKYLRKIIGQTKVLSLIGAEHLFFTRLVIIWVLGITGIFPFCYPLLCHAVVVCRMSFPLWFMTFLLRFNLNWNLFWLQRIKSGGRFIPSIIAIFSEFVRVLIRPFTLTARLVINIFIGQLLLKLRSSIASGFFLPFIWFKIKVLNYLGWVFVRTRLWVFESVVVCVQCTIFFGLLVFYIDEVLFSPR